MSIYNKRGQKNYKEKKLLKQLEPLLRKKMEEDPSFKRDFVPANNYTDLQRMYDRYVVEDIDVYEEITSENKSDMARKTTPKIEDVEFEDQMETVTAPKAEQRSSTSAFIDPFNREEPIVRDYVMGDESLRKGAGAATEDARSVFAEPTSFKEAFEIPTFEEDEEPSKPQGGGGKKREVREPLNPNFEDMEGGKKKRSTRKFAKYIVEAVSVLAEKGFVWYANSDINDAKLAEYEMTGEMDLSLLVSLEDGQEVTVKQFFQVQTQKAELLAKWTEEQKEDLSSALAEVLMEKGVAPTPTQELLLVSLTIIGGQAMTLFALKSQTNSLLNQLRAMKKGQADEVVQEWEDIPTPPKESPKETPKKQKSETPQEPMKASFDFPDEDSLSEEYEEINDLANLTEEDIMLAEGQFETIE